MQQEGKESIYHYKMSRMKRSKLFVRMALVCIAYILGLYLFEAYSGRTVDEYTRSIYIYLFSAASLILGYIAWWHVRNPATYEATITSDRFTITYPGSDQWTFDVNIAEIDRFENRQSRSGGARGTAECGIVMKSGEFHEIVMNYGNSVNKMHAAISNTNPNVTFSKKVVKY